MKLLLALHGVLLGACGSCPEWSLEGFEPTLLDASYAEEARASAAAPSTVPPLRRRLLLAHPIVDIHTHTFNARYLPLKNIALGKRDANFWLGLLPDVVVVNAVRRLLKATPLPPQDGETRTINAGRHDAASEAQSTFFHDLLDGAREVESMPLGALHAAERVEAHRAAVHEALKKAHRTDLKALRRALGWVGTIGRVFQSEDLLVYLTSSDGDLPTAFQLAYSGEVDLLVSHMMDLAPSYAQKEDGEDLLKFPTQQVDRMAELQLRPLNRMLYFVAYNPFRGAKESMASVKDAIENRGAYGVKIYPPSGYRPIGNEIPKRPRPFFSGNATKQWEKRYGDLTASELDKRLEDLITYCDDEDIPIFVHCETGEFEARKGYGLCMADPRAWHKVLQEHETLRLCFAHAGGEAFWFGGDHNHGGGREDWGRLVYQLCVEYENVYCEFGAHGGPIEEDLRQNFVGLLSSLIGGDLGKYPLERKIIYGSDWFMPTAASSELKGLRGWQEMFLDVRLAPYFGRFFSRNAFDYLNVQHRLRMDSNLPQLPADVTVRLRALMHRVLGIT